MDATKAQAIICNIAVICVGTMAIGLFFYRHIRQSTPSQSFAMPGKVKTDTYDLIDLGAAALLIIFFVSQLIAVATLSPEATQPTESAHSSGKESTEINIHSAISLTLSNLVLGICVFLFASTLRNRKPSIVFGISRLSPIMALFWSVGVIPVAYLMMNLVDLLQKMFFNPGNQVQKNVEILLESDNTDLIIVQIVSAILVAPLVEEIIFRGYLYAVLKRYSSSVFAAITTSLLFAVVHNNLPGMMPLFILALILTLAYELTGCLWVPMLAHALFNATQVFRMLYLQNG